MPIYEYECTVCHRRTEKRMKFSDPELTECPFCQGKLERTVSAPAFQFAGGGWYKDLYSSAKKDSGSSSGGGDAKPSTSADTGSDSKPAAAPSASESKPAAPATAPAASSTK